MKLLLDQNNSHRRVSALQERFPGSAHVRDFGLQSAGDADVWGFALREEFVIVSKDEDLFTNAASDSAHPPRWSG